MAARLLSVTSRFHLPVFATCCGITSPLLFALSLPPITTYRAYGFLAMYKRIPIVLRGIGSSSHATSPTLTDSGLCICADVLAPTINLFVVQRLPQQDRPLDNTLTQTSNRLGRALGLAMLWRPLRLMQTWYHKSLVTQSCYEASGQQKVRT